MIELEGKYTDAQILGVEEVEEQSLAQIQAMIDHEAFTEPVRVMPDAHPGKGSVIGFTMPLGDRIIPNVIGVDIGCFTGETKVPLLDGNDHTVQELAGRDEPFIVYSAKPDGEIVCTEATARKTRTDAPLVEVTLDNGREIRCTPDHEFMLRDGSYCRADELKPETSLMPLYRDTDSDGYSLVKQNCLGASWQRAHWIAARSGLLGDIPSFEEQKTIIHHKNFDEADNRPENLEFMGHRDHSRYHRKLSERNEHWQSEEFEKRRLQAIKQYVQTEQGYKQKARIGTENITQWMEENPEKFAQSVAGNGKRGKQYLTEYNKSERGRAKSQELANQKYECEFCGEEIKSYIGLYNHKIANHPDEHEFENHSSTYECDFCGRECASKPGLRSHQRAKHPRQYEKVMAQNHEVVDVTSTNETDDVYCLNVPEYHNFALSAGVFVHNCGMQAANLGSELPISGEELDEAIRARVPMGFGPDGLKAPERDYYHVKDEFPWHEVNETLEGFIEAADGEYVEEMRAFRDSGGYDIEYFKDLCSERAGRMSGYFDVKKGISSMGTLGSGNHFIEIGRSAKTKEYWVVVHSGSRGLGANTASYWQEQASRLRDERADRARETLAEYPKEYLKFDPERVSDSDLLDWLHGGKGEDFVDYEALKAEFGETNPDRIEEIRGELKAAVPTGEPDGSSLDYLEGEEAAGYLIDMIFCQRYAAENRKMMARAVADVLGVETADEIESTHNFIDFRDCVIRKGATRSHEGERVVIPFNMRDGTLIVEGKSNPEWNYSVSHGAGRLMSRTQAKKEFDEESVRKEMEGIQTSVVPLDEAPGAYKDAAMIEEAIGETAEIVDRLEVVHNLKAP